MRLVSLSDVYVIQACRDDTTNREPAMSERIIVQQLHGHWSA